MLPKEWRAAVEKLLASESPTGLIVVLALIYAESILRGADPRSTFLGMAGFYALWCATKYLQSLGKRKQSEKNLADEMMKRIKIELAGEQKIRKRSSQRQSQKNVNSGRKK
ncbi:hypothetical protein ACOZ4Y_02685 [Komagataeibacter rhaeticus]